MAPSTLVVGWPLSAEACSGGGSVVEIGRERLHQHLTLPRQRFSPSCLLPLVIPIPFTATITTINAMTTTTTTTYATTSTPTDDDDDHQRLHQRTTTPHQPPLPTQQQAPPGNAHAPPTDIADSDYLSYYLVPFVYLEAIIFT